MMYPYMTLNDDTEITHSEMKPDGQVKVYIETPDLKDGFHNATCWLPGYRWECNGYSDAEMFYYKKLVRDNAHNICSTVFHSIPTAMGFIKEISNICQ